jgi:hypothetical protein
VFDVDRFWAKVERGEGCWRWRGGRTGRYGAFRFAGRGDLAHRVSWVLSHPEENLDGFMVQQTCCEPLCVRFDHLRKEPIDSSSRNPPGDFSDRFWSKVDMAGPLLPGMETRCWVWTGALLRGYGLFHFGGGGGNVLAHRFLLDVLEGPLEAGVLAMHACDNPPCVRPDHLRQGTVAENQADMARKGRAGHRGERSPQAKLTEEIVRDVRRRAGEGESVSAMARELGVSSRLLRGVVAGLRWSHVV